MINFDFQEQAKRVSADLNYAELDQLYNQYAKCWRSPHP